MIHFDRVLVLKRFLRWFFYSVDSLNAILFAIAGRCHFETFPSEMIAHLLHLLKTTYNFRNYYLNLLHKSRERLSAQIVWLVILTTRVP